MHLHEICDSHDIDSFTSTPFVQSCVLHLQPLDVDTLKLCASALTAHEVKHSTEMISWSGVQGPA